jgi:hypothetical protein
MERGKSPRGRYVESDKSSPEDERVLNRLLALLSGRGEFDWGKIVDVEDGRSVAASDRSARVIGQKG